MNSPVFRRTLFLMAALLTVFGFGMMRGAPATFQNLGLHRLRGTVEYPEQRSYREAA
jgi:hypothetical protein